MRGILRRKLLIILAISSVAALAAPGPAAAWRYKFKDFLQVTPGSAAGGVTKVEKCGGGKYGVYRFLYRAITEVTTSYAPEPQEFELEIRAKMPITEKFKKVHDISSHWTADLPSEPELAALLTNYYNGLEEGIVDFYDGMFVRWHKGEKLEIRHNGLYLFGTESAPPGELKTPFKPKPGC